MRLILFGRSNPAVETLDDPAVREMLRAVGTAGTGMPTDPPEVAVRAGLVTVDDGEVAPGPLLELPPPDDDGLVDAAADEAARIITDAVPDLSAVLGEHEGLDWGHAGLLTIGGVLLDLGVGERLCEAELVGGLDGSPRVWMLPDADVAVGMECAHDPASAVGAAVMWTWRAPAAHLPSLPDLAPIVNGSGTPDALALLRLRHGRWLDGNRPRFLTVRRDGPLWRMLTEIAVKLAESVYAPVFTALSPHDRGHPRLILSRLIFERVLGRLVDADVITGDGPLLRRLAWTGPQWQLMSLELGEVPDER